MHLRNPFSSLSHFVAFLASLYVIVVFQRLSAGGNPRRGASLLCFGFSLALLFGASATYHALDLSRENLRIFQMIDQSAIYILIAGTYTPTLYLLLHRGWVKTASLSLIWGMAICGIICKWALTDQPYWLVVAPYIALGWVGSFIYKRLHNEVGFHGMSWVLLGGLAYSLGAVIDWQQWPDLLSPQFGPHELFHVFVIAGALFHIIFVFRFVEPHRKSSSPSFPSSPAFTLPSSSTTTSPYPPHKVHPQP